MVASFVATRDSWMENESSSLSTRVLLVEDHEGFRSYVRTALAQRKELELVGTAGDGLEAVEKCRQLQPDLVLMDIGLPRLNGLEAARRILAEFPTCKVVFLTQEHAPEIREQALKLGGSGYVLKTRAARDLFPAMKAAREGLPFVSSDGIARTGGQTGAPISFRSQPITQPGPAVAHSHEVHIYPDEESLVADLASFIERSLKAEKAVMAFLTPQSGEKIVTATERSGFDVKGLIAAGRLVILETAEVAPELLLEGDPDCVRLTADSAAMVEKIMGNNPGRQICVCGECANDLFSSGRSQAAMMIESIWDELAESYHLDVFCAYLLADIRHDSAAYEQVRAVHSLVAVH